MFKIKVNMTEKALYDFLLYHAYSKWTGLMVNVLGIAFVFMGLIQRFQGKIGFREFAIFFAAGVFFLSAVPVQLKLRARKQVKINPDFNQTVDYDFSDDGIIVKAGERERRFQWTQMTKTVVTPKCIGIYYGKDDALIIPKWDFGDLFVPIFEMSMYYTEMNRLGKLPKEEQKSETQPEGQTQE